MVPKVERIADLDTLDAVIAAIDPHAAITYFPVVTETAAGVVNLPEVAAHHRVDGVCWGAEDLSAALGATTARDPIRPVPPGLRDGAQLVPDRRRGGRRPRDRRRLHRPRRPRRPARESALAAAMGFAGKITIHPSQIDIVNDAFTPSPERIADAAELVAEFERHAADGRLSFLHNGQMVDAPHLARARALLVRAGITA